MSVKEFLNSELEYLKKHNRASMNISSGLIKRIVNNIENLESEIQSNAKELAELREDKELLEFMIKGQAIWIEIDEDGFSEVFDGGSQAISSGKTPREAIRAAMKGGV